MNSLSLGLALATMMWLGVGQTVASLPTPLLPSDVEITLARVNSGGCNIRCIRYRITIRGNGSVTYEDLAEPTLPAQVRAIPVDEVISLANEFLHARFFELPNRYAGSPLLVRWLP